MGKARRARPARQAGKGVDPLCFRLFRFVSTACGAAPIPRAAQQEVVEAAQGGVKLVELGLEGVPVQAAVERLERGVDLAQGGLAVDARDEVVGLLEIDKPFTPYTTSRWINFDVQPKP